MDMNSIFAIAQNGMAQQMQRSELSARRISLANMPIPSEFVELQATGEAVLVRGAGEQVATERQTGAPLRKVYDPESSVADANGYVHYLDVDIASEFIAMNLAKRSYEAHIRLFNNASDMAAKALEIGR